MWSFTAYQWDTEEEGYTQVGRAFCSSLEKGLFYSIWEETCIGKRWKVLFTTASPNTLLIPEGCIQDGVGVAFYSSLRLVRDLWHWKMNSELKPMRSNVLSLLFSTAFCTQLSSQNGVSWLAVSSLRKRSTKDNLCLQLHLLVLLPKHPHAACTNSDTTFPGTSLDSHPHNHGCSKQHQLYFCMQPAGYCRDKTTSFQDRKNPHCYHTRPQTLGMGWQGGSTQQPELFLRTC